MTFFINSKKGIFPKYKVTQRPGYTMILYMSLLSHIFYALFSLLNGMVSPLTFNQPYTPSIHLLLGLPLPLLPTLYNRSICIFTNLSPFILSILCANQRRPAASTLSLKLPWNPHLFLTSSFLILFLYPNLVSKNG